MFDMEIKTNMEDVLKVLHMFKDSFATKIVQTAANDLAFETMYSARKSVSNLFKSQKLSTSIRVKKARGSSLFATIYVDDYIAWKNNALITLERGGDRRKKGMEKAMIYHGYMGNDEILTESPGANIKGWVYVQIMAQLKLQYKSGYNSNETEKSKTRREKMMQKGRSSKYILIKKGNKQGVWPGIYVKVEDKLVCLLRISKKPMYKKRWDLKEIAQKVYDRRGATILSNAILKEWNR